MTDRDLAMRAIVTKYVADVATAAIKARRVDLGHAMKNGDRIGVDSPDDDGIDLGHVLRTKPKGTAAITDRVALTAWLAEHYPDRVEDVSRIAPGKEAAALAVLAEHAPELLHTSTEIADWAEAEILRATVRLKQACGPGGEADVPGVAYEPPGPGTITVNLSPEAPSLIERLWREGRIDLTTGAVRELPAGES